MRCFLIEQTKLDTRSAEVYGEPVYLFGPHRGKTSMFQAREFGIQVCDALEAENFNLATDYLVLAGNTVAIAVAVAAIVDQFGPFKALAFDSQQRRYVPVTLGNGGN